MFSGELDLYCRFKEMDWHLNALSGHNAKLEDEVAFKTNPPFLVKIMEESLASQIKMPQLETCYGNYLLGLETLSRPSTKAEILTRLPRSTPSIDHIND